MMKTQHLLVLGAARSGTTLLASMIGCHPDVGLLNEDRRCTMKQIIGKRVVGNKIPIPSHIEMSRKLTFFTRGLYKLKFIRMCRKLGLLNSFFPGAYYSIDDYLAIKGIKILGIVRNPDDVVSSMMRREGWSENFAICNWARATEILHMLRERLAPNIHIVTFEDLVGAPEKVMRRLTDFLGIEFDARMMEGCKFNPIYPESRIRREKVNRASREGFTYEVDERRPAAYRKYLDLAS